MTTSRPDPRDDLRIPPPVMDVPYQVDPTGPTGTVKVHEVPRTEPSSSAHPVRVTPPAREAD